MTDPGFFKVRCIDNRLQRDVLTIGRVYTVCGETDADCWVLDGLGPFTKTRFEVVEEKADA